MQKQEFNKQIQTLQRVPAHEHRTMPPDGADRRLSVLAAILSVLTVALASVGGLLLKATCFWSPRVFCEDSGFRAITDRAKVVRGAYPCPVGAVGAAVVHK